ncbi:MAG: BCCT family transporter, partial [Bacillota bacterium]|nr:BCCT family transporter [Bacillota bacterium]
MNKLLGNYDKPILIGSCAVILILGVLCMAFTESFGAFWNALNGVICTTFGWWYFMVLGIAFIFLLILGASKYGKLKLGKPGDKPRYTTFTWVAMVFSAGIGVSLYFYVILEPLSHFEYTPYLANSGTVPEAAMQAMAITVHHNGIVGWSAFCVVAVALAYAAYRLDKPLSFVSSLYGVFGEKTQGPLGRIITFLYVIVTIAGLTTTLGLGVMSISYMFQMLTGIATNAVVQLVILFIITAVIIISVAAGIEKGMAKMSNINIIIALGVTAFVLIMGPTVFLMNLFPDTIASFITSFPYMLFHVDALNVSEGWMSGWTIFYWAWWIAWAPFVGSFLAKISKGRSLRSLIYGGIFLPALLMIILQVILGGTALNMHLNGVSAIWEACSIQPEAALGAFMDQMPLGNIFLAVTMINVVLFVATSVDAGANSISSGFTIGTAEPT